MSQRRVAVICTVLNEAAAVPALLRSLATQTRPPDEIVIVDGGSTDGTTAAIERFCATGLRARLIVFPGANISAGRNKAISAASADIIASTDAGVRLSERWLEALLEPFDRPGSGADVVAGWFESDPHSLLEATIGATTLPALREIDPARFLPSSRSVAFTKEAWARVGGYPEWLDYSEDVIFDLKLREAGCRFFFSPAAVVYFRPRGTLRAFFKQYYQYARGDGKAGLWPRRHLVRYCSYVLGALALTLGFWYKIAWLVGLLASVMYLQLPYRRLPRAWRPYGAFDRLGAVVMVPVIRLVGDVGKMIGYPVGILWRRRQGGPHA